MNSKMIKSALLALHLAIMFAVTITSIIGINNLMRWADGVSLSDPGGNANVACFFFCLPASIAIVCACIWRKDNNGLIFSFIPAAFAIIGAIGFSTWGMIMPAALLLAAAPLAPLLSLCFMKLENSATAV